MVTSLVTAGRVGELPGRFTYFFFGWYDPGGTRKEIASRFHPLMATIAIVRFTNSASVNCARARSYTSSGTCDPATSVTASVHSRAARSRSV